MTVLQRVVTGMVVFALAACGGDDPPDPDPAGSSAATLAVSSTAFEPGGELVAEFGCDGTGTFPGLAWAGVPESAQSLAVTVLDPDAPGGTYVHLLVADLPAGTAGLADVSQLARGATLGTNGAGDATYAPPCPPADEDPHHYVFTVYAADTTLELGQGYSLDDLGAALDGHVLASGSVTATFER